MTAKQTEPEAGTDPGAADIKAQAQQVRADNVKAQAEVIAEQTRQESNRKTLRQRARAARGESKVEAPAARPVKAPSATATRQLVVPPSSGQKLPTKGATRRTEKE